MTEIEKKVYLDNSATTRVDREVAEVMMRVMTEDYGNPSSLHRMGLNAEKELSLARKQVARVFGAADDEIIFTSGGTESDNMAILGAYQAKKRESNRIITTKIEHPAVLETIKKLEKEGAEVVYIDVDENSRLDMDALKDEASKGVALISIMAVNNETGALMPLCLVDEVKGNALLHCDAVQALGKEDITSLPGDLISVSGHKIHGPKGIGALKIKKEINIPAFITGGGQEKGRRSGTENLPGIIGFGLAAEKAASDLEENREIMKACRNRLKGHLESGLADIVFNSPEEGTPAILNVSFLGTKGEVILHTLEQKGIYVSTGSACSSKKKEGSHVLTAMGLSHDRIEGAIRFSFSKNNTLEEMDYVADCVKDAVDSFRRLGSFR